jgi:hypothetical protein
MMFFGKRPDPRLRILELMQREQLLPLAPDADFEAAKQRCLACNSKKLCDEGSMPRSLFCPNAHYLRTL